VIACIVPASMTSKFMKIGNLIDVEYGRAFEKTSDMNFVYVMM